MRLPIVMMTAICLGACSGGGGASNSPKERAAAACEAEAKVRIGEKTYQLDIAALAQSAKLEDDVWAMQAPIVIEPGLRDEAKQTLECKVRVQDGKPDEVTYINFIF
ncbi:MAG: hypothetical protein ACO24O_03425 [Arenimonas sp.]|uniref:hypothetical protein n=1 Tax=Arenimonas sp. TaxID=1872635 RepID=UPI003BFDCF15